MDTASFREALGHFATGVTIVTASGPSGPVGLTVNSFSSVSLDPPLVLWSLKKSSSCIEVFSSCEHFCVHVLSIDQVELSKQFAKRNTDKFAGVSHNTGVGGAPLLDNCCARFECETRHQYEGGDHVIFVGEVVRFDSESRPPLLFHGGVFHSGDYLHGGDQAENSSDNVATITNQVGFTENFFPYLMARAHFQINEPIKSEVERAGIDDDDCFVLLLLSIGEGRTIQNIARCLEHTNHYPTSEKVSSMHERGLVAIRNDNDGGDDRIFLSDHGKELMKNLLLASDKVEQKLRSHFGAVEVESLKRMLRKVILRTDPGVPDLWQVDDTGI